MNDKNWIRFRMVAWSIVAILLAIILAVSINGWGGIFSSDIFTKGIITSNKKVVKDLEFDNIENIKNIKTDFTISDLTITENNEDDIKVIVKSNRNLKDKKYIKSEINSNTLTIEDVNQKTNRNIFNIFKGYSLEVEIKIPKSYKGDIEISNKVGNITFDSDLDLNNLDVDLKTGDINGTEKINSKKVTINNKVGDIDFEYLNSENLVIKGKTGDINIEEFIGEGSIESQIGDINCRIDNLNGDFDIKSRVGDVELYINRDLSFIFEGNKDIGEINTSLQFNNVSQSSDYFTGQYGDSPTNKITTNIKTGDISLNY